MIVFDPKRAIEAQKRLAKMVVEERLARSPDTVCGVDVTYIRDRGFGAAVVLSYPKLEFIEVATAEAEVHVPYVPTLLAFREMPVLVRLVKRIKHEPDVFMVDGHGIYHPRRCGLATHFGVAFGTPTIGVAKEGLRLEDSEAIGDMIVAGGKVVGRAMGRIFVSIGNKITLEEGTEIVRRCMKGHRVPEPLFLAHKISKEVAKLEG